MTDAETVATYDASEAKARKTSEEDSRLEIALIALSIFEIWSRAHEPELREFLDGNGKSTQLGKEME